MKKIERCAECGNELIVSKDREECLDMCDECYKKLVEKCKLMSDRDYRMDITRAATAWASNTNSEEGRLRAFFACVMPEYPQHKVDKFIKATGKSDK